MATETVPVDVRDALAWLNDSAKAAFGVFEAIGASDYVVNHTSLTGLARAGYLAAEDMLERLEVINAWVGRTRQEAAA